MTNRTAASLLIIIIVLCCLNDTSGLGTNAEIEENELGLTSRACASKYCPNKSSLDLWLAIEWYCHAPEELLPVTYRNMKTLQGEHYTRPIFAGFVCAILGIFSFIIGFSLAVTPCDAYL